MELLSYGKSAYGKSTIRLTLSFRRLTEDTTPRIVSQRTDIEFADGVCTRVKLADERAVKADVLKFEGDSNTEDR